LNSMDFSLTMRKNVWMQTNITMLQLPITYF